MTEKEIAEMRQKTVVKANEIIQKSRFNLSLQQQKVVLFLISQITPYDDEFKYYEFRISDFCRVCGISAKNGKNHSDLRNAIKDIADKSMWITLENGDEALVRWIEKPYINRKTGTVRVRLNEDLKPFLLQLKDNFTRYELFWTLNFKSKYSIRLYELVKSIHYHEMEGYRRTFGLEELKRLLDAESYKTYQDFKTKVLEIAIKEINKYSEKIVHYTPIKEGRSVAKIQLDIGTKPVIDRELLRVEIENKFELSQTSLMTEVQDG